MSPKSDAACVPANTALGGLSSATTRAMWSRAFIVHCALCITGCGAAKQAPMLEALPTAPATIRLALGGDVMVGRWRDGEFHEHGGEAPFAQLGPLLAQDDMAFFNLETAACESPPARTQGRPATLAAPLDRVAMLSESGVDIVSVANNHSADCGAVPLERMQERLERAGTAVLQPSVGRQGARPRVLYAHVDTHPEVVFLGFNAVPGAPWPGLETSTPWDELMVVAPDVVRATRAEHPDALLVVSLHWGRELHDTPTLEQVTLGRALVDGGADVVAGHHAHVLQPIEVYRGGVIAYSLGNLLFDMAQPEARMGAVVTLHLGRERGRWATEVVDVQLVDSATGAPLESSPLAQQWARKTLEAGGSRFEERAPGVWSWVRASDELQL